MLKELKDRWSAALRSGRYRQSHSYLKTPDGFCCLGVLCDVFPDGGWDENGHYGLDDHHSRYGLLPSIMKRVGITHEEESYLANENDQGVSFEAIANHIEENL